MPNDSLVPERLYPALLGEAWTSLDPAVQRVHLMDGPVRATGTFRVCRAPGRLMRLVLDLASVPRASDAVPVRLAIAHQAGRRGPIERWHREFSGRPLATLQAATPAGRLAERIGPLEFQFRLAVDDEGALLFEQERCTLQVRRLRLALPGWLAPRIWARECATAGPDQTTVTVTVCAPGGRLLFSYMGTVTWGGRG